MSIKFEGEQAEALNKILLSFAGKTLNKTEEDLASIFIKEDETFNTEALEILLQIHSEHLNKVKGDKTQIFNDAHSKAKSEVLGKAEAELKARWNVEGDFKLDELVNEIVKKQNDQVTSEFEAKQITPLQVQEHELYKKVVESRDAMKTEYETRIQNQQMEFERIETNKVVSSFADQEIAKLKPVLDADPVKAANQKKLLVSQILQQKWKVDNGSPVAINDDGTILTDSQQYPIKAEDIIKGVVTSFYSLQASDAHNPITANGNNTATIKGMPKNNAEYIQMLTELQRESKKEESDALRKYVRAQPWYKT